MKRKLTLISKIIKVNQLKLSQMSEMFSIFKKYYANVTFENFQSDLLKKDDVILLLDKNTQVIKGFSTLLNLSFTQNGKKIHGLFSGDTIIEKEYWGNSALQVAFTKYMLKKKLKNPLTPLYWLLISKGYKTYLLLTNNFPEHYPRYDQETPHKIKEILDTFSFSLYPEHYNAQKGLIEFPEVHDHLKDNIAPITEEMKMKNPNIQYFTQRNPNWIHGTELVCLAHFNLGMPIFFFSKLLKKMIGHKKQKSKATYISPAGSRA